MSSTKITEHNGQYRVTVPKALAESQDLKGANVEWIDGDDGLTAQVKNA